MIDFHSHILPNIDDGSRDIKETFDLIKEAEKAGFNKIISTSHYMEYYYEVDEMERSIWINALNTKLQENNINVDLYLGSEIYISEYLMNLIDEKKASSINNTKYILFEMPMYQKTLNLYSVIFEMIKHNKVPILAHPERYTFIQDDIELITELIENGVLMQSNFGSFKGLYGKKAQKTAKELLKRNMIHFLGSDVHRAGTIYPMIKDILTDIEKIVGKEKIYELTEKNASIVLNNEELLISEPKKSKRGFKRIFVN